MERPAVLLSLFVGASGHGAVTHPPPRQAIDGQVYPWNGTVPNSANMPFMFMCAHPDSNSADPRNLTASNGQACFWFNNGCDISCEECDGSSGQLIQPFFRYNGSGPVPPWQSKDLLITNAGSAANRPNKSQLSICKNPKRQAKICDPKYRTINVDAPCHSEEDVYQYAPWRSPGAAPVIDACGVAGGVYQWQGPASAGGDYKETIYARRGDLGSKLPKVSEPIVWSAGTVEVAWTMKAWHGGGYQYRLCPANEDLTEACFQRNPVAFADHTSSLRWGGVGGSARICDGVKYENCNVPFNATDVSVGTLPMGSTWRKGPIPPSPWAWEDAGSRFEPPCKESEACLSLVSQTNGRAGTIPGHNAEEGAFPCQCSGWGDGDLYRLEIVDKLLIPDDLAPGDYVLGWRWDCEQSSQIWSSCSDVTLKAPVVV